MRSSRSSDGSRYKILFIISLLLLAIVCVLYLMKMQEVSALSVTLEEAKREADGTEWGLNQKVTELQQRIETQTTQLRECQKKVIYLGKESNTSKKIVAKCGEDLANLQKSKDSLQEHMTEADNKMDELEAKVDELQSDVSLEKEKGDACHQQLADSQAKLDKCSQSADAIKSQLMLCTQNCPVGAVAGNAAISNPVKRGETQPMPLNQPRPRTPSPLEQKSPDPQANVPKLPEPEADVAVGEAQETDRDLSPKELNDDYEDQEKPADNVQNEF